MATKSDSGFGLLSEYGLDLGTEDDVRSKLRQKRISDAMKFVPESGERADPNNVRGSFGYLGAALGNAVGESFRQERTGYGDLPPEIANRLAAVKGTKDAYAAWERTNPDLPAQDRMDKYQEILAEQAFKHDLPDIGIPILRQLTDRRDAKARQDAELKKLNLGNQYEEQTLESRVASERYRANKEGVVQFYLRDSQNPNAGFTGFLDKEGNVTTMGEDGKPKVYSSGQYTFDRPQWHPSMYSRGGGSGQDLGKVEEADVRRTVVSTMSLTNSYADVLDHVKAAATAGVGPVMGQYGKLASLVNRWTGFAEQIASAGSPDGSVPSINLRDDKTGAVRNFDSAAARQAWAMENAKWFRKHIPGLEQKGAYADKYIALMTELAYAKAMAMEGGSSRSLSDNDFKNSVISIGGNLNDPKALAGILLSDADRRFRSMEDRLSVYSPQTVERVVNERGFDRLRTGRQRLEAYRSGTAFTPDSATPAPAEDVPEGVDPRDWAHMTEAEKALFR